MSKLERFIRSFHKNVIQKRKFKAFFLICFSTSFRKDLNYTYELTKDLKVFKLKDIHYSKIKFGHRIIYPDYVVKLIIENKQDLPFIRVVKDGQHYRIVDGNHRFIPLMLKALKSNGKILCEVMQ